jgi:hypothetical protein
MRPAPVNFAQAEFLKLGIISFPQRKNENLIALCSENIVS